MVAVSQTKLAAERGRTPEDATPPRLGPLTWRRSARFADNLMGPALLAGPANVIMQLARPGVGYGVLESPVQSGRVDKHPYKRARTTFSYLAVAVWGDERQKAAYRAAVNRSHVQVRSTESSPVQYSAFSRDLQLWVAACLYRGNVDVYNMFIGHLDDEAAEKHYRESAVLGTTLQVPLEMWPEDRAAFDEYWNAQLEKVNIDDAVRDYLYPIATARAAFPKLLRPLLEPIALLVTTGFLPQRFRDEMQLSWGPVRQAVFHTLMAGVGLTVRATPRLIREFPFNALLADVDRRIRRGIPLV